MATAAQLYAARNAGLKLAHVTQPYAQGDIILKNEADTAARAAINAAVDAAIAAATAVDPTKAVVSDGQNVSVKNSSASKVVVGVAGVAGSALVEVKLPASEAIVANGSSVAIQNSEGIAVPGNHVRNHVRTVVAGSESNIKLASNVAPVVSGLHAVAATGTGTKVTFTVANGAITAITLSA